MKKTAYILVSCRNTSREGFAIGCDSLSFDREEVIADMVSEYKAMLKEYKKSYGEQHLEMNICKDNAHICVDIDPSDSCSWRIFEHAIKA